MDEDFGTPEAVAVLFELAGEVNKTQSAALAGLLKSLGGCIGLLQGEPAEFLQWRPAGPFHANAISPPDIVGVSITGQAQSSSGEGAVSVPLTRQFTTHQINDLIAQRAAAKAAKNFAEADRIRQDLLAGGIVLKDSPAGTTWESQS